MYDKTCWAVLRADVITPHVTLPSTRVFDSLKLAGCFYALRGCYRLLLLNNTFLFEFLIPLCTCAFWSECASPDWNFCPFPHRESEDGEEEDFGDTRNLLVPAEGQFCWRSRPCFLGGPPVWVPIYRELPSLLLFSSFPMKVDRIWNLLHQRTHHHHFFSTQLSFFHNHFFFLI